MAEAVCFRSLSGVSAGMKQKNLERFDLCLRMVAFVQRDMLLSVGDDYNRVALLRSSLDVGYAVANIEQGGQYRVKFGR